jgi:hypothetical protein
MIAKSVLGGDRNRVERRNTNPHHLFGEPTQALLHSLCGQASPYRRRSTHMQMSILTPILALVCWTFVLWFWLYATRIPALRAAKIDPAKLKQKQDLDVLPVKVRQVADNYNHLHEQPTVFYALAIYSHLVGVHDELNVWLAWTYVAVRVLHSLIQCTSNFVPLRFSVFTLGSLVLMVIAARNVIALVLVG